MSRDVLTKRETNNDISVVEAAGLPVCAAALFDEWFATFRWKILCAHGQQCLSFKRQSHLLAELGPNFRIQ